MSWHFNNRKLNPTTLQNENNFEHVGGVDGNYQLVPSTSTAAEIFESERRRRDLSSSSSNVRQRPRHQSDENEDMSHTYMAIVDRVNNVTISRLKIKSLDWFHKGVYKCKYDQAEAFYNLDFESIKFLSHK